MHYDKTSSVLKLTVTDSGVGIREEGQKKIFQVFFQDDMSNTKAYEGTDLGLTISWKLAGLMEGDITVKSVLGEGSSFTVTLVLKEAERSQVTPIKDLISTNIPISHVLEL